MWNNGATTQSVTSNVSYNYVVIVTDNHGCSGSASQSVTVNPVPVPFITASGDTTFCTGDSVVFDAGVFTSYMWTTGATDETITVMTSGTYKVTVTNSSGCTASASSATVTVHSLPTFTIVGATSICTGDSSLILHSNNPYVTYIWSTGASTDSLHVLNSGSYTLTVTDANGCSNSVTKTVVVDSILHPTITGATVICAGTSTTLDAGLYHTYHWNSGNATTETINRDTAGTYVVTVHDSLCSGSDSVTVIVNALPFQASIHVPIFHQVKLLLSIVLSFRG
jgi:hypothetical protein